ncbi:hypothetical protein C0995_007929 [Termitomyces sp. Mi166|nr:hypothetical protein C0995_007929 [Termitomyces sp. Mi166\
MIANADFTVEKPIETAYQGMNGFDYVFVPLPGMARTITHLVKQDPLLDVLPQEHSFPYTTLPVLHLQVQPHYVVFDLFRKIMKHEVLVNDIRCEKGYEPYFHKYPKAHWCCSCMYHVWLTSDVPRSFVDNSEADTEGQTKLCKKGPEIFVDEVGLRPMDSVTFVSDYGDGEDGSDDDGDEFVVDETDSAFELRMTRWVADLQPGLTPPDCKPSSLDIMKTDQPEAIEDMLDGSPTMVGSI